MFIELIKPDQHQLLWRHVGLIRTRPRLTMTMPPHGPPYKQGFDEGERACVRAVRVCLHDCAHTTPEQHLNATAETLPSVSLSRAALP